MRWDDFRQSENVEDRTGDGPLAGPGFPLPTGSGGMGIGTIIILGLLAWAVVATSTQADGQLVAVLTPAPPQDAAPSVRVRPGTGVGLP